MNEQEQAERNAARRKLLNEFLYAVEQMRHYQTVYFKNRLNGDKVKAIQWEREVDKLLKIIRKKQGAAVKQEGLL